VLSSVEEVLTKWKNDLLAETPSSGPAEQGEKFPRNKKHDSTTPGKLLDRCWETTASLEEVKFATIAQKNKKAPGPDELYLQKCSKMTFAVLFLACTLFTTCLKNCCIPSAWRKGTIVPIPKNEKDDPRVPLNYRGISLLSLPYKVFTTILNERISECLEKMI